MLPYLEIIQDYLYYLIRSISRILFGQQNLEIQGTNSQQLIVGIPGIFGGSTLLPLAKYLKEKKQTGVVLDLGFELGKVESYVEKLKAELDKLNSKKITLIGYSMGGLIAVLYANKYGWNQIEKIITIATPFKGAPICNYLPFIPAAKDTQPNSNLLKKVSKINIPKHKLICCYFKNDELVKKDSAIFKNTISYQFKYGGHFTNSQTRNYFLFFEEYLLPKPLISLTSSQIRL